MKDSKNALPLSKVLVVLKETDYARAVERKDSRMLALIGESDSSTDGKRQAHDEHCATVESVREFLRAKGINHDTLLLSQLPARLEGYDLIITVGGDGTFLSSASRNLDIPMLGVRSTPSSVGHFSLTDMSDFAPVLEEIIVGKRTPSRLMRMAVTLERAVFDGKALRRVSTDLEVPVLNDVLIANRNAAAGARYIIEFDGRTEKQESSGLWVGPPPGSSGGMRSAGGKLIPITSRDFEFVVREPSIRPGRDVYDLIRGTFTEDQEFAVVSRMDHGKLFVDGEHRVYDFTVGDRAVLRRHAHDLVAFIDENVNDRYEYFAGVYQPW